jgi:hypothetical protein
MFASRARSQTFDYETPPTPCKTQNSGRRVTPETASNIADARCQRSNVRPDMNATTAPKTAPPAPTGATTLPIQINEIEECAFQAAHPSVLEPQR